MPSILNTQIIRDVVPAATIIATILEVDDNVFGGALFFNTADGHQISLVFYAALNYDYGSISSIDLVDDDGDIVIEKNGEQLTIYIADEIASTEELNHLIKTIDALAGPNINAAVIRAHDAVGGRDAAELIANAY